MWIRKPYVGKTSEKTQRSFFMRYVDLSFVLLIKPIPAKKNMRPKMPNTITERML